VREIALLTSPILHGRAGVDLPSDMATLLFLLLQYLPILAKLR
jgi:hypothetical protein